MPSRDINTKSHITHDQEEKCYAYSYSGQVECTFIADKFLRQEHSLKIGKTKFLMKTHII